MEFLRVFGTQNRLEFLHITAKKKATLTHTSTEISF